MRQIKRRVLIYCMLGLVQVLVSSSVLAEWSKAFVVEWSEPAFYYGGVGNAVDSGTDCPYGANPDPDWYTILVESGYKPDQAAWLLDPANRSLTTQQIRNQFAFRGKNKENVLANPTALADPGFVSVTGKIGEGINLDDDVTTGFISPTGERGVDNAFYKALGCWKYLRGMPRKSASAMLGNDYMRNGAWTLVIVVTGHGNDSMNDDDIMLGLYMSRDKLVKDALGQIVHDYSFRIMPHEKYEAIFNGKIENGRITTKPTSEIYFRDSGYGAGIKLLNAQGEFSIQSDNTLTGYIAGYRSWQQVYDNYVDGRGVIVEIYDAIQLPALWYTLQRHADFGLTGAGGEKTHISYVQRVTAVPAYAINPEENKIVESVKSFKTMASNDGLLVYYPQKSERRPFKDGLILRPGETTWTPLTDEEMTPPTGWLNTISNRNGNAQ